MTKEDLDLILEKHKLWLNNNEDGERANFSYADLRKADLSCADLTYAVLKSADLRGADFSNATLKNIDGLNYFPICPNCGAPMEE